jgi:hypothetical protein
VIVESWLSKSLIATNQGTSRGNDDASWLSGLDNVKTSISYTNFGLTSGLHFLLSSVGIPLLKTRSIRLLLSLTLLPLILASRPVSSVRFPEGIRGE